MTSAPSMDPSGLAAAIDASLKQRPVSDIIRAYLSAARSVPEAGKAVDDITRIDILREWFGGERYARDYEYLDANFGVQADRVVAYLSALASIRSDRRTDYRRRSRPAVWLPTQALEWCMRAAAALTSLSGQLAEAEQRESTWRKDLTASEAEATSLRRKLEEATQRENILREALERARDLTPAAANAHNARDLHLTVSAIAGVALDRAGASE